jgi:4-amino-4-deoxy-L-arabinose transferase-like glycosyltransferase
LNPALNKNDEGVADIMMGRYISLFFSLFTIIILYRWGSELYGTASGLVAAFLYSFCPNSLANASFVSTDGYSVLMLLLTLYLFWKWIHNRKMRTFVLLSIVIAFSQLVKQSLFHLYVMLPLLTVFTLIFVRSSVPRISKPLLHLTIFIVINFLVINLGYYFYHSFQPLGKYHFMSDLFIGVQNILPSVIPVPLPSPFIEGLDMAKYYDQIGGGIAGVSSFGKVTIMGQEATGGSFWYYYIVTIFFKTPIAILILFVLALFLKPKIQLG